MPHPISRVVSGGNLHLYVIPRAEFSEVTPNYVPGNEGFAWISWHHPGGVFHGIVLVDSDLGRSERAHLIREELTQALGLLNDSYRYPDSIFFQRWTSVTEYAPIDRAVISLLYEDRVTVGMTEEDLALLGV